MHELESRDTPAHAYWSAPVDYNFQNPANWGGTVPGPGDYIHFEEVMLGNMYTGYYWDSLPCNNMAGEFAGIYLENGYDESVTFSGAVKTGGLTFRSGVINQPTSGTALSVQGWVTWEGGVLNSTSNLSTVHFLSGSYVGISPGPGNGLITGSTLSFESTSGFGSTGTFTDGAIQFNNGADLEIESDCVVDVRPFISEGATVAFNTPNGSDPNTGSMILLKEGGSMNIYGKDLVSTIAPPYAYNSSFPIKNDGGTLKIYNQVRAYFGGRVDDGSLTGPSVRQESGKTIIEGGSTLAAQHDVNISGELGTKMAPGTISQVATVEGDLVFGGTLRINNLNYGAQTSPRTAGTLFCTGDVHWVSGTYKPVIDAMNGTSDMWEAAGSFHFIAAAGCEVAPATINVPIGGIPNTSAFEIVKAGGTIGGPVSVSSPDVNYELWQIGNPVKKWALKKV